MIDLDDILKRTGQYGRFQMLYTVLFYIPGIPAAISMLISYYTIPALDSRCRIPEFPGDTYKTQSDSNHSLIINRTIPGVLEKGKWTLEGCKMYKVSAEYNASTNIPINASTLSCNSYVYDHTYFTDTVTEQFNIVCDKQNQKTLAQIFFMIGVLLGALVLGQLSDSIGRKKTFLISVLLFLVSSTVGTFMPNYWAFSFFRLLTGASNSGIFLVPFVMVIEIVGPDYRVHAGIIIEMFFAAGYFALTLLAYYIPSWKTLTYVSHLPWALLLLYAFIVPESMRWLNTKGRYEEAEVIVRKMAKMNGTEDNLPEQIVSKTSTEAPVKSYSLISVFRSKVLLIRALNVFFNWFVNTLVYYGLTLNSGNLGGSPYVNFLISGAVEMLAYIFCIPVMNRFGRKWPLCLCMVIGGAACISTLFIVMFGDPENNNTHNILLIVLSMIGKCLISASFAIIYVFTAELFPTVVRNVCMGASSTCARVGGILSPLIADISLYIKSDFGQALPLVIFGVLSVLAGIWAMALPETNGKELPSTIEEGEQFGRKPKKSKKYEQTEKELEAMPPKSTTNSQVTLVSRSDL